MYNDQASEYASKRIESVIAKDNNGKNTLMNLTMNETLGYKNLTDLVIEVLCFSYKYWNDQGILYNVSYVQDQNGNACNRYE